MERALITALFETCRWTARRRPQPAAPPRPGDEIALHSVYAADGTVCRLELEDLDTGAIREVALNEEFRPAVEIRRRTRLPAGYAVPRDKHRVLQVLDRHGLEGRLGGPSTPRRVEAFRLGPRGRRRNGAAQRLAGTFEQTTINLDDHVIFPVPRDGGRALATLLEPRSAARLGGLDLLDLREGERFPVLRVL